MHQVQRGVDGESVVREGVLTANRWRARLWSLVRLAWPQWSDTPRLTAVLWSGAALISLVATMHTVVSEPTYQSDLSEVRSWLSVWIRTGASPYDDAHLRVDYPPHGLMALRWLTVVPRAQMLAAFPWVNLLLTVLASWQIVRWFSELQDRPLTRAEAIGHLSMLLASRAVRRMLVWGQTASFAILLFVLAMRLAHRRPTLAGLCLGVASYKLNLAAGFGLALLLLGQWWTVLVAASVAVGLTLAFAVSVGQSVATVVTQYVVDFFGVYGGEHFVRGATGLRTALMALLGDYSIVRVLYPAILTAMLLSVCVLARGIGQMRYGRRLLVIGCLLFSLAGLTHQRYNLLLLMPVLWILRGDTRVIRVRWIRWSAPTAALVFLVGTLPAFVEAWLTRALASHPAVAASIDAAMNGMWVQGSRVIVLSAFGLVLLELWRLNADLAKRGRRDEQSP